MGSASRKYYSVAAGHHVRRPGFAEAYEIVRLVLDRLAPRDRASATAERRKRRTVAGGDGQQQGIGAIFWRGGGEERLVVAWPREDWKGPALEKQEKIPSTHGPCHSGIRRCALARRPRRLAPIVVLRRCAKRLPTDTYRRDLHSVDIFADRWHQIFCRWA